MVLFVLASQSLLFDVVDVIAAIIPVDVDMIPTPIEILAAIVTDNMVELCSQRPTEGATKQ